LISRGRTATCGSRTRKTGSATSAFRAEKNFRRKSDLCAKQRYALRSCRPLPSSRVRQRAEARRTGGNSPSGVARVGRIDRGSFPGNRRTQRFGLRHKWANPCNFQPKRSTGRGLAWSGPIHRGRRGRMNAATTNQTDPLLPDENGTRGRAGTCSARQESPRAGH
jgi:hypothetical protein